MAIDNVRERLALHFDAEASLESRVARDCYEVHIRMPYRTKRPESSAASREAAPRQAGNQRNNAHRARAIVRPRRLSGVPLTEATGG